MPSNPARYRVVSSNKQPLPEHDLTIGEFEQWLHDVQLQPVTVARSLAYKLQRRGILSIPGMFEAHYAKPTAPAPPEP